MMDFSKFDSMVNVEGLKQDIENAAAGIVERVEVPVGTYEVKIEKLELGESKKGDPMVKVWFRILNGEFEKQMLFMNQVVTQGFQIHIINQLLRSMDTGLEIQFNGFQQYAELLEDVFAAVDKKKEFALEYGDNKGFKTFKIIDVFNV